MRSWRFGSWSCSLVVAVAVAGTAAASQGGDPPPVPYEDPGACPFEGCSYSYRQWTTKRSTDVLSQRRTDAPVVFRLAEGEKVTALGGIVITTRAGRVEFRSPTKLKSPDGAFEVVPGEPLHLLTYEGEGFFHVWFKGRLYRSVDAAAFYNGVCEVRPLACTGKIVEKSQTEWWVQLRNRDGRVGWVLETGQFSGQDALSAE
jgi:hypothetical protein